MIRFFDMFAGVGGFRAGLTRAGGFECVGHSEIDKHADASYRAVHCPEESEVFYPDARTIDPRTLPDFDLLCGGFPCQSFSVAGRRKGFEDVRGTLFFELARIAAAKRPPYLLFENVPGLLSHDQGKTFAVILGALSELGYGVEWMVLNAKDFGVPQSRRRVFLIGYLDPRCAGKILPHREANPTPLVQLAGHKQAYTVYDSEGVACTQTANTGGLGKGCGLYLVGFNRKAGITGEMDCAKTIQAGDYRGLNRNQTQNAVFVGRAPLLIKENTKRGFKEAYDGDSVYLGYPGTNQRRARVGSAFAHTLDTNAHQGVVLRGRIRRLTPRECFRLQGFEDDQIDRLLAITSDAQAYKQAGNAVTVNVIEAIGRRLRAVDEEIKAV